MKDRNVKRPVAAIIASLLLSLGVAAPAFAHGGEDHSGSTLAVTTTSTDSGDTSGTPTQKELKNELRNKGRSAVQKARQEKGQAKSAEVRQKSCEARKANLEKRMDRAVAQATKHKAVFDKIYDRAKSFHDSGQLNTPDYDALVTKADDAKQKADDNLVALKDLNVDIDCTSGTVADGVAAFKEAVGSTRDSLKAYRTAIKDLLSAMNNSGDDKKSEAETETNN